MGNIYSTRKIGGRKYTVYHYENTKREANLMAGRYRAKGMKARVVSSKGKWAVCAR